MFNIGPMELIVVLAVALVIVGPKRLPEIGRTIGRSLKEFRRAQDDFTRALNFDVDEAPSYAPASRAAARTAGGDDEDGDDVRNAGPVATGDDTAVPDAADAADDEDPAAAGETPPETADAD